MNYKRLKRRRKLTILHGGHQAAVKYKIDLSFIAMNFSSADLSDILITDMCRIDAVGKGEERIFNRPDRIIVFNIFNYY